jgi:hypothetical protein
MVRKVLKVGLCALTLSTVGLLGACGDDDANAGDDGDDNGTGADAGGGDGAECDHLEGCPPDGGGDVTQTSSFTLLADSSPVDGSTATAVRSADGIQADITVPGLMPGVVYTYWWVVYQNPELCTGGPDENNQCLAPDDVPSTATDIQHIIDVQSAFVYGAPAPEGGVTADDNGTITLSRTLAVNSQDGFYLPANMNGTLPDGYWLGLTDPLKAEVHVVVRAHGPEGDGGIDVDEQRSNFNSSNCAMPVPGICNSSIAAAVFPSAAAQ